MGSFHFKNPTIDGLAEATPVDDDSIFGVMTSNVDVLHELQKNELGDALLGPGVNPLESSPM
jgi:hypothetical protein